MASPQLSVVIPTHRRPAILAACLEHLERQSIADRIEVIVVSDGHDPATVEVVTGRTWKIPVTFQEIAKSQQGTARNVGVREATAPVVLFINDDIFLVPGACEAHLTAHAGHHPIAVLGHIEWDPAVGITPVMRWLEETGWQFGFDMLADYKGQRVPEDVQHRFTYASNLSLPLEIARATPFPEGLTEYGWEDVVFGMDLRKKNVGLVYEPSALGLHRHRIDLPDSLRRMRAIGRTMTVMAARDPAFDRLPRGWKLHAYRMLSLLPTLRGKHAKALLEGIRGMR